MIGKLNTVDGIVEVHDARLPFIGRNKEFRDHLGAIKPRVLVLNKSDLADLSRWDSIKNRLEREGEKNVVLTDLSGSDFGFNTRGYNTLIQTIVDAINHSERNNRQATERFKLMVVGIPNVGKSSLINRLRQLHVGFGGEPAKVGPSAGVTRRVEQMIRICSRPPIYSLDTPGVLQPSTVKNRAQSMQMALCSSINDTVLEPLELARYLLAYLNEQENYSYSNFFQMNQQSVTSIEEFVRAVIVNNDMIDKIRTVNGNQVVELPDVDKICWRFIKAFRKGCFGKVMFD